jgi:hypothetical protein
VQAILSERRGIVCRQQTSAKSKRLYGRDHIINDFTPLGSPNWLKFPRILANVEEVRYA